jgi:hypothetical protein
VGRQCFRTNDLALWPHGEPVRAWYNTRTGVQSFGVKPNAIVPLASTQSPEIAGRYGIRACFLDVHSAVYPWHHVDYRAGEPGAGTFAAVWNAHRELWAFERKTYSGPVLGEGRRHWFWSGWLDGVEAEFGSGWLPNAGMTAPLNVDFDLLRIHPLQFNHGMGYYGRWWSGADRTRWAGVPPMVVLDQYRMQEVAYGHAGFVDNAIRTNVPLVWLECNLVGPVMRRYATARPVEIAYRVDGEWRDAGAAVRAGGNAAARPVRIAYENGLTLTANGARETLPVDGWLLPAFGWLARGAGVTAGTVLRQDVPVDFADTPDALFVNARSRVDWNPSPVHDVRPAVGLFEGVDARTVRVSYAWQVGETLTQDYRCLVHFTADGVIRWQHDHWLAPPCSQWQPGDRIEDGPHAVAIPADVPDGDYAWLIGLFNRETGVRLRLTGPDDGSARIRLGVLHVRDGGSVLTFTPEPGADAPSLYAANLNALGATVNFGDVRTDGSARIARSGGEWVLQTWPRRRAFTLELRAERFEVPAGIRSTGGATDEVLPVPLDGGAWWRLPLNGAREYRWPHVVVREATLVPAGAVWKFDDSGRDLGQDWRAAGFDDRDWRAGPARIGFGNGDEATALAANGQVTTYFRHAFVLTDPADIDSLTLRIQCDDGAVVYLNGAERLRVNLADGPVAYNLLALADVPDPEETAWQSATVAPGPLVAGTNWLAAELHQSSATGEDASFDLEAKALVNRAPSVSLTAPANGWTAATNAVALTARPNAPDPTVASVRFLVDGVPVGEATAPPFAALWTEVAPGDYRVTARATFLSGRTADSAPARVCIGALPHGLVSADAVWRYDDTGADLGAAWAGAGFDDSTWPVRRDATQSVRTALSGEGVITTYYRHTFELDRPPQFAAVLLRLRCSGGLLLHVNGAEVLRRNMPMGSVDYLTRGLSNDTGGGHPGPVTFGLSSDLWRAGTNTVAAELHRGDPDEPAPRFDLEIVAFLPGSIPRLAISRSQAGLSVRWPGWDPEFRLRACGSLGTPVGWTFVTNPVAAGDGWRSVHVPAGSSAGFFQLGRN